MTPSPKPRSRPKPPRGKTLHGHAPKFLQSCAKCRKRRAHNQEVAKRALLKQRRAIRTKIKAKGKPRFKQGRDPNFLAWIRQLDCARANVVCVGEPVQAAHVKSRGAGGGDIGNVIPLCRTHHQWQHQDGVGDFSQMQWGDREAMKTRAVSYGEQYRRAVELGWTPGDV